MPSPPFGNNYATLSAMITPALLMTASSSLIISTSNRMSRIVDRVRAMIDLADRFDRGVEDVDFPEERLNRVTEELGNLEWRSDCVRIALTLLYLALSAFVGTSLMLAIDALLGSRILALPTALAVIGVCLMLAACVNLTREAHRALRSNRQELRFHREILIRRQRRLAFADFLDRVALGKASTEEWQTFVVEHYGDDVLEDIRRRCVRLSIGASSFGDWSVSERESLQALATELRHPGDHLISRHIASDQGAGLPLSRS